MVLSNCIFSKAVGNARDPCEIPAELGDYERIRGTFFVFVYISYVLGSHYPLWDLCDSEC